MIKITKKEEDLFLRLYDLLFLDREYIRNYLYVKPDGSLYSEFLIKRNTQVLEKEGYIKSVSILKDTVGGERKAYTLDKKGVEEVEVLIGDKVEWDTRWTDRTPSYIYHSLRVAYVQGAMEKGFTEFFEYVEFISEKRSYFRYGELKDAVIRPDGALIFKREFNGQDYYFLYFIEMERSRQRRDVTLKKLQRYNAYCKKKAHGEHAAIEYPIAYVGILFICNTNGERDNLYKSINKVPTPSIGGIYIGTYEDVIQNPFGDIWRGKDSADQDAFYFMGKAIRKESGHETR